MTPYIYLVADTLCQLHKEIERKFYTIQSKVRYEKEVMMRERVQNI